MDVPNTQLPHHLPSNSSTSAIDLTQRLGTSNPSSPSLDPSERTTRRRASWGRAESGQDSLRIDLRPDEMPSRSDPGSSNIPFNTQQDPFFTPPEHTIYLPDTQFGPTNDPSYGDLHNINAYTNMHPGPSSASLLEDAGDREDEDEPKLTVAMSRSTVEELWNPDLSADPERNGRSSRRHSGRYGAPPSPLKKTTTAIKEVGKNIHRMSVRVVNLGSAGLENQIRSEDEDSHDHPYSAVKDDDWKEQDIGKNSPLRGRTLGLLGPTNPLRITLFHFLVHPYVT
jgi:hypothetical protein